MPVLYFLTFWKAFGCMVLNRLGSNSESAELQKRGHNGGFNVWNSDGRLLLLLRLGRAEERPLYV